MLCFQMKGNLVSVRHYQKLLISLVCSRPSISRFRYMYQFHLDFTICFSEINGVTICYKMGNAQDSGELSGHNGTSSPPERPPRPSQAYPGSPMYPSLQDGDHDYEILRPGHTPSRPAPPTPRPPPVAHQNSVHTLSNSNFHSLDGVPFVVNPKFFASAAGDKVREHL